MPSRSPSNVGLEHKVALTERQESTLLLNPEKTKDQIPKHVDQGQMTKEKTQQLHKDTGIEKTKERDSSHC